MAIARRMTRPSEVTRERIIKAAERLFAESGYDGTSVRAIVAKAKVNQAAINYHFEGKDGLYREVLRGAFRGLTEHQLTHAEELKSMSREEALSQFIRRQLQPLLGRDEYSRHMRIFNWRRCSRRRCFATSSPKRPRRFSALPPISCTVSCRTPTSAPLRSPRSGCSANAAFSCATASNWRSRPSGLSLMRL